MVESTDPRNQRIATDAESFWDHYQHDTLEIVSDSERFHANELLSELLRRATSATGKLNSFDDRMIRPPLAPKAV